MAHNIKHLFQLPQLSENTPSPLPDTVISYVEDPPVLPRDLQALLNAVLLQLDALQVQPIDLRIRAHTLQADLDILRDQLNDLQVQLNDLVADVAREVPVQDNSIEDIAVYLVEGFDSEQQ
ncbi:hypothetical protein BGX29_008079 [Mortierella sp. GBA35]|nr:hypothetical protein BGX29_008079 [Mortierella sp. GBA35]